MGLRADVDDPLVGSIATLGRSVATSAGLPEGPGPSFEPRTILADPADLLDAWNPGARVRPGDPPLKPTPRV